MLLDWEFITDGYNHFKKAKFESDKTMLVFLYQKYGSSEKIGQILGVCQQTVFDRLQLHNVQTGTRADNNKGKGFVQGVFEGLNTEVFAGMTIPEIALRVGLNDEQVYYYVISNGIEYLKRRQGRPKRDS